MGDGPDSKRTRAWTAAEIARERAAGDARSARAHARKSEENVKQSVALARFANRVAAAARAARRHEDREALDPFDDPSGPRPERDTRGGSADASARRR